MEAKTLNPRKNIKELYSRNNLIFVYHYEEGFSINRLSRKFNLSPQRVCEILKKERGKNRLVKK